MRLKKRILILGASGMLGHKVFEFLSMQKNLDVWGTVTDFAKYSTFFPNELHGRLINAVQADRIDTVEKVINEIKPEDIINCIGIIKQNDRSQDHIQMIQLNALFPHQIAKIADGINARVITVATDCVFDGKKQGAYMESDPPNSYDLYGLSKYLGEIHYGNHLSLRTSIIGHEINSSLSLLDWFLNDTRKQIPGYTNAVFSGLTTLEFAKFLYDYVLFNKELKGLYHLSVDPISKFDLLRIIANQYSKKVELIADNTYVINRALNSDKLRSLVGYKVPKWEELILEMHKDYLSSQFYISKGKKYEK